MNLKFEPGLRVRYHYGGLLGTLIRNVGGAAWIVKWDNQDMPKETLFVEWDLRLLSPLHQLAALEQLAEMAD